MQTDITVEHTYVDIPFEIYEYPMPLDPKYEDLKDLHEIEFKSFITLHNLFCKVYCLQCDSKNKYKAMPDPPQMDNTGVSQSRRK